RLQQPLRAAARRPSHHRHLGTRRPCRRRPRTGRCHPRSTEAAMTGTTAYYSDLFQPRQRGMKVLVACEYSGIVRNAFLARGHDAWSCDLLPSEDGSNRHITADAREILNDGWDLLMVAHPPCTRLCNSGVRWLSKPPPGKTLDQMWHELRDAADLFSAFWNAAIERICVENPVMHRHAKALIVNYREFTQSVQPWQFGH